MSATGTSPIYRKNERMVIPITLAMLPWVGGKQALFKTIIKRFPSDYRRRTYVEVFGGGGTMLLNKDRSVKEIFNDANGNLINLYRVVRQQPEELMRRLTYVLNSKADFLLTKEQIKLGQYRDPVQWAADYYQLIKQSYAGKGSTFGGNGRSMWAAFPLIDAICARLQYVVIKNADFGKVIPANDSPNTVFYLDPPYYFTEDYYPGQIFTEADHYRLFETIMGIKGLWLLSYNFCPETVDLYSKPGLYIEKLERPNNMAQKYDPGSMYEEILVSNFDTSKPRPLQMSLSGDAPEEREFIWKP